MEESKSIWSKTAAELTVKDQLVVSVVFMAVPVVALMGFGAAVSVKDRVQEKLRERRNAKNNVEIVK